jgi:excisionase family DNA binding protein
MASNLKNLPWEEVVDITVEKLKDIRTYKPKFKEWMLNLPVKKHLFDHKMYFRCWQISESLRNDNDHFIVMLAPPGTGKSTLFMQMGATISPNFRLNQISYDFESFVKGISNKQRYDIFHIDEGALVLNSADRSSQGQMLDKLSAIMRQFNLCVGICMVDFLQLRRHFRDTRINTLVLVTKRGRYRVLTGKAIDAVRQQIRNKNGNIHAVRYPSGTFWDGYFSKDIPELNDITESSYLEMKHKNAEKFIKELNDMVDEVKDVDKGKYISVKEATTILSVSRKTVIKRINEKVIPAKKFGNKWLIERDAITTT